ncbi:DUF7380 domain-containing protein [Stenotrophomonas sp. NPDC077659]|uniref:DUF7380 domain-containing protein n=1 Tax=Stenotrophomonas sp. NPDC077659 TaxID=3390694 RepID=UPI003CFCD74D
MHLQVGSDVLLTPRYITPERWSAGLGDMDANDFAAATAIARNTQLLWLRARCADVALASDGAKGREIHELAALGADAYLRLVRQVEATTADVDINTVDHLRRALDLGWKAKKKDETFQRQVWSSFSRLPGLPAVSTEEAACRAVIGQQRKADRGGCASLDGSAMATGDISCCEAEIGQHA